MDWTVDRYLERLYSETPPEFAFRAATEAEWAEWRKALRAAFQADLGGFHRNAPPLAPKILEEVRCDGYIRQRISFLSDADLEVPAYVLIPDGANGRLPAVMALSGHGYGSREIVGLDPEGNPRSGEPTYQKDFAVELVRRGFLVIAPELMAFGDRRLAESAAKPLRKNDCHRISTALLMSGRTMAGERAWEAVRTIDYLLTRGDVDPERIGCMGISGGGTVCAHVAALDDRVKAAVVSGYVNTYKDSILAMDHCIDNYIPGILRHAEMPDIVGLIAPRPLLMESGTQDTIYPLRGSKEAYERIGRIYGLLGAREKFDADFFDGDHRISGAKAYDWLLKWL